MINNYIRNYKLGLFFLITLFFMFSHIYNHHIVSNDCAEGIVCSIINTYNNIFDNSTDISINSFTNYLYLTFVICNTSFSYLPHHHIKLIRAPPFINNF